MARFILVVAIGGFFAVGVAYGAVLGLVPQRLTVVSTAATVPVSTCTVGAAEDSRVHAGSAGNNYGNANELHVRSSSGDNRRSFLRFDLSSCAIPSSARVTSAQLSLFLDNAPNQSRTYEAHAVTASWSESTITWLNQPGVAGSATATTTTGSSSNVTLTWNVGSDVQSFVGGGATNDGWRIKDQTESSSPAQLGKFGSSESGQAFKRPSLAISYYP